MSSEESSPEDKGEQKYVVRRLSWEGNQLQKVKKKLDKMHKKSLSPFVRKRLILREDGPLSLKPRPDHCPAWACQTSEGQSAE